jgi:antitoxin component YwqK of YwqJK toxin-antitoxin module
MKNSSQTIISNSYFILLGCCLLLISGGCNSSTPKAQTGDLAGFESVKISGTTIRRAERKDPGGQMVIEGYVDGGKKTGQWIEYSAEGDVTSITNYVNGLLEGPAFKMSFRGQVDQRLTYHLNQLDGPWIQYKFGKIQETRFYKNGKLDGSVRIFDDKTFKIQQESEYKDGQLNGHIRYYDENGDVSVEYEYKNGEKVSGGIVKKE